MEAGGDDPGPEPQAQEHGAGLGEGHSGGVVGGDDPERGEFVVDDVGDVVGAHGPVELDRDGGGDDGGGGVGGGGQGGGDEVEQAGQLDDLPVTAAQQELGLGESGGLVHAEQLRARGQTPGRRRPDLVGGGAGGCKCYQGHRLLPEMKRGVWPKPHPPGVNRTDEYERRTKR